MLARHARESAHPLKKKSGNVKKVVLSVALIAAALRVTPWALRKLGLGQTELK